MSASAPVTHALDAFVGRRGAVPVDLVVVAALVLYVALFLAVRRATNACFFVLALLAVLYLIQQRTAFAEAWRLPSARMLVGALASVFAAAVAAKLLRGEFDYRELDGPSRYLLGGLVLLYLTAKRIRFVRVFAAALPLAPMAAIAFAPLGPEAAVRWEGRFATAFVDPNVLGSYAVILTFMILLTIESPGRAPAWQRGLAFAGVVAGLALAMLAASRGGWLAVLPLTALWFAFRRDRGVRVLAWHGIAVLALVALALVLVPEVGSRGWDSVGQVRGWLDGTNPDTAPGHRLSIWKLALELVAARPLLGYGWPGVVTQLAQPDWAASAPSHIVYMLIHGGPHSDLLMMTLSHGVLGVAAFAALLFVPAGFFWRRRLAGSSDARLACELGLCLVAGVFICGLSNEMLSLKYLASFYALTVAGLAAQVLGDELTAGRPPRPSAGAPA
jgi:O-antigen ligase